MLRVGLTGGLGSGKSTVAALLQGHGAVVISADELGRAMMQPGQAVFARIVEEFGSGVLTDGGELDRAALARVAFAEGRLEALNAIVHPAVIARQQRIADELAERDARAVLVVESALLFETQHGGEGGWRRRFDRVVLVTAPEDVRVERYVARVLPEGAGDEDRAAARAEARRRMERQMPDAAKRAMADFVVANEGGLRELEGQVEGLWRALQAAADGAA